MLLTCIEAAHGRAHTAGVVDSGAGESPGHWHGACEAADNVTQAQRYHLLRCVHSCAICCKM